MVLCLRLTRDNYFAQAVSAGEQEEARPRTNGPGGSGGAGGEEDDEEDERMEDLFGEDLSGEARQDGGGEDEEMTNS